MEKLLDVTEITNMFKVTRATLDKWEKQGNFPRRIKIGKRVVAWKESDIENFIKNNGKIDANLKSHP